MKLGWNEEISTQEKKLEETISVSFRKFLNTLGLQSRSVTTSYGQMHYYDSDPTSHLPPFVFIHGIGSSGQSWWLVALALTNKFRILIPDLFHMSGFSECREDKSFLTISEHAASLHEFITLVAHRPIHLCGLSLGGWLSMILASSYPALIEKLILMNPAGIELRSYGLRDTFLFMSWKKFRILYPGLLRVYPHHHLPIFKDIIQRGAYLGLQNDSVKDLLKSVDMDDFVDKKIHKITAPTLLLWGSEDKLLPAKSAIIITNKIKNIQGKWVHKCAHVLCIESPLTCYTEINNFLHLNGVEENSFVKFLRQTDHLRKTSLIEKTNDSIECTN